MRIEDVDSELPRLLAELRPISDLLMCRYRIPAHALEDLIQETAVALLLALRRGEISDPESWWKAVLWNRCVAFVRSALRERRAIADAHQTEPGGVSGTQQALRLALEIALAELPQTQQRLLRARYFLGCSRDDSARRAGLRASSFSETHARALRALRRGLG